jgi:2-pyrone-4,6-dicarboxylate lactonase
MSASAFRMDDGWLEFHQNPSKPAFRVPPGTVDAHCHVFGPGDTFPYAPERKYTPCDAPREKLWQLRDHLGIARNVIVQATCHGADNRALVAALQDPNGRARGVATVRSDVGDEELEHLNDAGVRGVRFSFVKRLVDVPSHDILAGLAERVQPLGWHLVIYVESQDLPGLAGFFASLPVTIVFDHMARPDVSKGVQGNDFETFMRLLDDHDNMWAKVSCPDRLTLSGPPDYADVVPFARRVVEAFPDRVLWGTDWPHPNLRSHMPDDGKLVDYIPTIAVKSELQRKLLVDNPMRLYWPEEQTSGAR